MLQTVLDSVPKDHQSLCNMVFDIEKNTGLNFPNQLRDSLRIEYSDLSDMYEIVLELCRNTYDRELNEEEKADIKRECEAGWIYGIADPCNNKVYIVKKSLENVVKEDLIEDFIFEDPCFIRYKLSKPKEKEKMVGLFESLLTVHELGHILFHYLVPVGNIKFRTSAARDLWEEGVDDLNEAFADYIMIGYYNKVYKGIDMKFKLVIDLFIGNRDFWVVRKKHRDNMFSSDSPLSYIKERLEKMRP